MSASCIFEALPHVVVLIFLLLLIRIKIGARMINGYKTVQEVSSDWGITARRIQILCNQNRIKGAQKVGKIWFIPETSEKPIDMRKNKKV